MMGVDLIFARQSHDMPCIHDMMLHDEEPSAFPLLHALPDGRKLGVGESEFLIPSSVPYALSASL